MNLGQATPDYGRGDTGGDGEHADLSKKVAFLSTQVAQLQRVVQVVTDEKASLAADLAASKFELASLQVQLENKAAPEVPAEISITKEAARARLRRLCERKADGSLLVSEDIHQQFQSGGTNREKLLKVWMETGMEKVRVTKMFVFGIEHYSLALGTVVDQSLALAGSFPT